MYYRNKTDITADQGVEIDAGSLWILDEETFILTLVDEDQHITVKHSVEVFEFALKKYFIKLDHLPDIMKFGMIIKQDLTSWNASWSNKDRQFLDFEFHSFLDFEKIKELLVKAELKVNTLRQL
ncbi:hypothetical protein ACFO4P_17110 [Epilithonimonas pallida]|uniref:Uncharacterized protein n=1 Tax=Epilithonimonas pallida TaxID=373671 RepID=A0ABY1R5K5_9FLAO|nr:hypothetical protein [Epilithonimonas pallida]SMP94708.1 hypothetical protein SAMN05421679_106107 [Epilithonimonas pallida]